MRNYPQLTEQNTTRDFIETFGGLNRNIRISDGEFADMMNLTSDYYPTLATRPKRGRKKLNAAKDDDVVYENLMKVVGMIEKDDLYCVCYYGGRIDSMHIIGDSLRLVKDGKVFASQGTTYKGDVPRQIVSMGAYIVIFPDGVYFNTKDSEDCGSIRKSYSSNKDKNDSSCLTKFFPCDKDGNIFNYELHNEADGLQKYIDNGKAKNYQGTVNGNFLLGVPSGIFYYWHEESSSWQNLAVEHVLCVDYKYDETNDGHKMFADVFESGDGLRISGFKEDDARVLKNIFKDDIDRPIYVEKTLEVNYNDTTGTEKKAPGIVLRVSPNIVEIGEEKDTTTTNTLTFKTMFPQMDYVIESGNRLWGCRYGKNNDGETVNEIYASKLGDFKNWETYAGVSTDSYTASLGSDGPFTGATTYLGYPTFFKQNCIHTVYGSFPAQYQIQTTECRGVQQGCEKSLVALDGALFYKAVGGVCAYTGSLPTEIGSQLNEKGIQFTEAIAGTYHHKYYLAMKDSEKGDGKHWLYVYDTNKGLWHKESPINVTQFCEVSAAGVSELYYYNGSDLQIHQIIGNKDTTNEEKVGWYAETGIMGCSSPDKKYISRLSLRLSMGIGTRVYVSAEYDSSGVWEQIAVIVGSKLGTFTIPIRPKRCDHLRLRLEGDDEVKIYSISKTMEQGSDI